MRSSKSLCLNSDVENDAEAFRKGSATSVSQFTRHLKSYLFSPSADYVTHPGASNSPPSRRIMAPSYKSLID